MQPLLSLTPATRSSPFGLSGGAGPPGRLAVKNAADPSWQLQQQLQDSSDANLREELAGTLTNRPTEAEPVSEISLWDPDGGDYYGEVVKTPKSSSPARAPSPLKEGYVKTRVTEFEERGTAANSLSPAATLTRGRSRDGGAVNKPEATSTRDAVALQRIVRLGAVDILPINPATTSAASSSFSEKTTTTTSAVGKPAQAFSPSSRSQMKMNDASTQTLSWAKAIRENFAVDALRENLALLTTTTDPALNEEDADSPHAEGGIINSNGDIFDFSSKRSTTKARVSLQTLSSVTESTLTENEVAFFEAIWNLLSTGEDSIHEPERFDELVGRTNVSRRYLQAVSAILFATEFYTLSEGFGGGSAGKVISRGQFVVGLRLLAHAQELEAKEEAGEEFFAVVPFLSGGSLVDFAKTPPAKGVVRIEGVEWNGDTKRLKIRRPI